MAHAYVTFRFRLARHALRQFAASLRSSVEILVLVGTHVIIGLLGLSAFPSMYAASLAPSRAVPLLLAHALVMTIPLALLRKRVLPLDVLGWAHRLPLPRGVQLRADAMVAALLVGPLAALYAVSTMVLLYQKTDWLDPVRGVLGTLFSLALTFAFSIGVLALRSRRASRFFASRAQLAAPGAYVAQRSGAPTFSLWRRLFWLPFWRMDSVIGWQQSVLLTAALASALPWMMAPPGVARGLLALATCTLLVLLTDRGDKAVREQASQLGPVLAAWPIDTRNVVLLARGLAALPSLAVMLVVFATGLPQGLWTRTAGCAFLAIGCGAQLLLVATPISNERFRVGLVAVLALLLTAIGSELWP